ncbi:MULTISPECIES: 2-dehydro-3-deoxygalactonokinase [Hyphomicrobiales]|uniref:2-dehydro-3-deoxygalactonokinase n=1 Tax=Hyphomicrobiales TaxID=356 RepID=UPI003264474B
MTATQDAALIAVDWGTTNLRAMLLAADGATLAEAGSDDGIGSVAAGGHEAAFERLVAGWPKVPALMAGMIGSRQGWREVPYVTCPATPAAIAAGILRFETTAGRPVAIVPGVMVRSADRDGDVIRGEETQMVGLLGRDGGYDGLAILPGTHSKWATMQDGAIADFQTFLTGELFHLFTSHSFLRHSVTAGDGDLSTFEDFALGVRRTVEEGLPFLAAIFSVRARQLLDGTDQHANRAYLSGLVIGGEIAAARAAGRLPEPGAVGIVGARSLARAYRKAFEVAGIATETLDGTEMVLAGLTRLAREIDLLPQGTQP